MQIDIEFTDYTKRPNIETTFDGETQQTLQGFTPEITKNTNNRGDPFRVIPQSNSRDTVPSDEITKIQIQ